MYFNNAVNWEEPWGVCRLFTSYQASVQLAEQAQPFQTLLLVTTFSALICLS